MLVTESGIVTDCKDEHQENALSPMLVTASGMVMECKDSQYSNAWSPMLVTESGMVIDCKDGRKSYFPANAASQMLLVPCLIV